MFSGFLWRRFPLLPPTPPPDSSPRVLPPSPSTPWCCDGGENRHNVGLQTSLWLPLVVVSHCGQAWRWLINDFSPVLHSECVNSSAVQWPSLMCEESGAVAKCWVTRAARINTKLHKTASSCWSFFVFMGHFSTSATKELHFLKISSWQFLRTGFSLLRRVVLDSESKKPTNLLMSVLCFLCRKQCFVTLGVTHQCLASVMLPDYQTSGLPDYQTTRLAGYLTTRLPNYRMTSLPNYQTSRLPDDLTTELPR